MTGIQGHRKFIRDSTVDAFDLGAKGFDASGATFVPRGENRNSKRSPLGPMLAATNYPKSRRAVAVMIGPAFVGSRVWKLVARHQGMWITFSVANF